MGLCQTTRGPGYYRLDHQGSAFEKTTRGWVSLTRNVGGQAPQFFDEANDDHRVISGRRRRRRGRGSAAQPALPREGHPPRARARSVMLERMVAGKEVSPGDVKATERLHRYWVAGPGLKKWATSPHPWTALYNELKKYILNEQLLKATVSKWHYEVFHEHTGSDKYRVEHGGKARGKRIGPG